MLKTLTAAAVFASSADLAFAQTAPALQVTPEIGYILNSLLFLVMGILVMFMAIGFAMLEAGFVRSKNATMQLTKNVSVFAVATIFFYLLGYHLMRPGDGWLIYGVLGDFRLASADPVNLAGVTIKEGEHSVSSDFLFQMMFCAATASIVSGSLAERLRLWPFVVFTIVLTALIYPVQASWTWGGGFLQETFGFKDFAGATVVHSVGGWAALAGALVLGARIGKFKDGRVMPMPASNLTLAVLGAMLLWLGWLGFNAGSLGAMDSAGKIADVSRIFVNTNIAGAAGALSAMVLTQIRFGSVDLTLVMNGALAGLVSITAEPLLPSMGASVAIGAVGGLIVVLAIPVLDRLRIDDVVGAIPVHLGAGIWGTMAVVFTNSEASIGGQLAGIAVTGGFVFGVSLLVWLILRMAFGIRVSAEAEVEGLDLTELGIEAYPDFALVNEQY